jgi:glycolate oxidase
MRLLFGEDDLDAMNRLRAAFDPDGFSNPGKVLPTPRACVETGPVTRDDALVG